MSQQNVAVNRTLAGVLAIGCGLAGAALCVLRGTDDQFAAGFIRASLLLGALWCAMPGKNREAAWANVSPYVLIGAVLAVVLVFRHLRVLLPIALVLAAIGYFLRPRTRRPSRHDR